MVLPVNDLAIMLANISIVGGLLGGYVSRKMVELSLCALDPFYVIHR